MRGLGITSAVAGSWSTKDKFSPPLESKREKGAQGTLFSFTFTREY